MTATEQLRHEHEAITLVLSILEKLCQRLANGEEVNPEHFGQVLEFIQVFADQCHHGQGGAISLSRPRSGRHPQGRRAARRDVERA